MYWNPTVGLPLLIIGIIVWLALWLAMRGNFKLQLRSLRPRKRRPARTSNRPDKKRARQEPTIDGSQATQSAAQPDMLGPMTTAVDATDAVDGVYATATDAVVPDVAAAAEAPVFQAPRLPTRSDAGKRPADAPVEKVVSIFLVAREGMAFRGSDLVVAMEKAGLVYGDMQIFHRLLDGQSGKGAIFSVANMLKPGNFELEDISTMETPGLSFFIALPAPLAALDAWDTMLPIAQRLAKLLDGQLLDEDHNALGRQGIAYMRDELRSWDRKHPVE